MMDEVAPTRSDPLAQAGFAGEAARHFDSGRQPFAPYGLTCDVWEPQQMMRPDRHDEIEINFLVRGTLTYLIGGDRVTVQPQRFTAFWAAVPHQIVDFQRVRLYYVVTVPFGWALQWGLPEPFMSALTQGKVISDSDSHRGSYDQWLLQQWHEDMESAANENRETMKLEIHARLSRLAKSQLAIERSLEESPDTKHILRGSGSRKAEAMARFIARNYTSPIQLKDIAESVGLHPDYAANLYRKTFGTTLNSVLTQHRIAHAQRLLITTNHRVVDVAQDAGFESLSRFNQVFKEMTGATPRVYRKTLS